MFPDSMAMWMGYWYMALAVFLARAATRVATISTLPFLAA